LGDELAPEGAEFCEGFFQSVAAVRRGVQGCRTDRSHDAGLVFKAPYSAPENEFSPDLLKDGFNCRDLSPHGVQPVSIRGERMENGFPRLPFPGRAATSAAANFRKIQRF